MGQESQIGEVTNLAPANQRANFVDGDLLRLVDGQIPSLRHGRRVYRRDVLSDEIDHNLLRRPCDQETLEVREGADRLDFAAKLSSGGFESLTTGREELGVSTE